MEHSFYPDLTESQEHLMLSYQGLKESVRHGVVGEQILDLLFAKDLTQDYQIPHILESLFDVACTLDDPILLDKVWRFTEKHASSVQLYFSDLAHEGLSPDKAFLYPLFFSNVSLLGRYDLECAYKEGTKDEMILQNANNLLSERILKKSSKISFDAIYPAATHQEIASHIQKRVQKSTAKKNKAALDSTTLDAQWSHLCTMGQDSLLPHLGHALYRGAHRCTERLLSNPKVCASWISYTQLLAEHFDLIQQSFTPKDDPTVSLEKIKAAFLDPHGVFAPQGIFSQLQIPSDQTKSTAPSEMMHSMEPSDTKLDGSLPMLLMNAFSSMQNHSSQQMQSMQLNQTPLLQYLRREAETVKNTAFSRPGIKSIYAHNVKRLLDLSYLALQGSAQEQKFFVPFLGAILTQSFQSHIVFEDPAAAEQISSENSSDKLSKRASEKAKSSFAPIAPKGSSLDREPHVLSSHESKSRSPAPLTCITQPFAIWHNVVTHALSDQIYNSAPTLSMLGTAKAQTPMGTVAKKAATQDEQTQQEHQELFDEQSIRISRATIFSAMQCTFFQRELQEHLLRFLSGTQALSEDLWVSPKAPDATLFLFNALQHTSSLASSAARVSPGNQALNQALNQASAAALLQTRYEQLEKMAVDGSVHCSSAFNVLFPPHQEKLVPAVLLEQCVGQTFRALCESLGISKSSTEGKILTKDPYFRKAQEHLKGLQILSQLLQRDQRTIPSSLQTGHSMHPLSFLTSSDNAALLQSLREQTLGFHLSYREHFAKDTLEKHQEAQKDLFDQQLQDLASALQPSLASAKGALRL